MSRGLLCLPLSARFLVIALLLLPGLPTPGQAGPEGGHRGTSGTGSGSDPGNLSADFAFRVKPDGRPAFLEGEVLIKLSPAATAADRSAFLARVAGQAIRVFDCGAEHWSLGSGFTTMNAVQMLRDDALVEYVEPNYMLAADLTPNDPDYGRLWGLHNTGQTGGAPGADIDAEAAWDILTGDPGVVVGVIDSGVDYTHPDLADNIWTNPGEIPGNGIDDDANGYVDDVRGWDFINNDNDPMDDFSHGTHVAGTIAAAGNNQVGVVGVSWRARIMPLKFLGSNGTGSTADAVEAVEYATMMGADITNNSWGGGGFSQALYDAIQAGGQNDVLFVASAGNAGINTDLSPQYPSTYDLDAIVSVAATDHNDQLASFSNYGLVTVDLGAPGVQTYSTMPGGSYGYKSGTSMAAPHVSGVAALLRSLRPNISISTLKSRLMDEGEAIAALANRTVSGNRLNALFAVRHADDVAPGGVADLAVASVDATTALLEWTAPGDDGANGTATSYHLRYSEQPISEADFDAATLASGVPSPQVAGTPESFTVDGLRARTTYFFAIKAVDEWGNRGPISNVPSATTTPGVPEIALQDEPTSIESTLSYSGDGALTVHDLIPTLPPDGQGRIVLRADGDFGDFGETATASAEGLQLGSVGQSGADCVPVTGEFPLTASELDDLAADGVIRVEVQNSPSVNPRCTTNEHQVTLHYPPVATGHDYGQVFVGGSVPWTIRIENRGNDVLDVTSITSDAVEFAPDQAAMTIDPGDSRELIVYYDPVTIQPHQGTLHLQSNDPDEADLFLDLSGEGIPAPDIAVSPASIDEALLSGETTTRVLTISNTGQHDLTWEIESTSPPAGSGPGGGSAPSQTDYDLGTTPHRGPLDPADLTPTAIADAPIRILLLQSGTDVTEIRNLLASYPDVDAVDVFDIRSGVPTLSQLTAYEAAIVIVNSAPAQRDPLGDVLADYADAGGNVVLTLASFINGWEIRGRLLDGYLPFELGSGPIGSSNLGDFVVGHPIMRDVVGAFGDLLGAVDLAVGAEWVADWLNAQPMIATKDLGVTAVNVFVGGSGNWSGDVPLILHNAALHDAGRPAWLQHDPSSGVVAPGSSVDVTVTLDATDLDGGLYEARLLVHSDDPDEPLITVPVTLDVTGIPDIELLGEQVLEQSNVDYGVYNAETVHSLPASIPPAPGFGGTIEVIADGDFGASSEWASVTAEGLDLGQVGRNGTDCSPAVERFPLSAADLAALAADGVVEVRARNTSSVDLFCTINRHTVTLEYRATATSLDYGELFIGLSRPLTLEVHNRGTDVLTVTVSSDSADFQPSDGNLQIAPRQSHALQVSFVPSIDGPISGTLSLQSNDPDEPLQTIPMSGTGVIPPDIDVSPAQISDHLFSGERSQHVLDISNTGPTDLEFRIEVASELPVGPPPENAPRSTGIEGAPPLEPASDPGSPMQLADPASLPAPDAEFRFTDDFEDGNFDGWFEVAVPVAVTREVTDLTAARGTFHSFRESGSDSGHYDGIYRILGGHQPRYARFFVRPGSTTDADGYFALRAANGYEAIFFFANNNGNFYVNGDVGGHNDYPYQADTWYEIEFRNIDFATKTFDYYVDQQLVLAAIPFRWPAQIDSFYRLDIYNFTAGAEAWWDEILIATDPRPDWIDLDTFQGVVPPGGTLPVTVQLDAAGMYGGTYGTEIQVSSNDPDEPRVDVPVTLQVTGAPDIAIEGQERVLQSLIPFAGSGGATDHTFLLDIPPAGGGVVELVADGDYGASSETATVSAEGNTLGQVGGVGSDCSPASGSFNLSAQEMSDLAADDLVEINVQNSTFVDIICAVNQHQVTLRYSGAADRLDFGQVFTGQSRTLSVIVRNDGTDVLEVTSISSDLPEFVPSESVMSLAPFSARRLDVTFSPIDPVSHAGLLRVESNDPDQPLLTIDLLGEGLIPPDIALSPTSLVADLFTGDVVTLPVTIDNLGGSDLTWVAEIDANIGTRVEAQSPTLGTPPASAPPKTNATAPPPAPDPAEIYSEPVPGDRPTAQAGAPGPPLEEVLDSLNARFAEVTDSIPNRFLFSEGETGTSIGDGGSDMYDGGNFLSTEFGTFNYSNNTIVGTSLLGPTGRYFTRKYPGLFVFVGDADGITRFEINGNLGADGSGSVDGAVLEVSVGARAYLGFTKRVYGAGDPSVNHLVIVERTPTVVHEFATNTNDDYHRVSDPAGFTRIHYLLYAGVGGSYIDNAATLDIMLAYLGLVPAGWLSVAPDSGTVPAGGTQVIDVTLDAADLDGGDYTATINIDSNDPDEPRLLVGVDMHVTGIPDINVIGELVEIESTQDFNASGASTTHTLPVTQPPGTPGEVAVVAEGDFGASFEYARVYLEGSLLGQVGATGQDCTAATDRFDIDQSTLAALAADGSVVVRMQNSASVNPFCGQNRHTVVLSYRTASDSLDFGAFFIGLEKSIGLTVENRGNEVLNVTSISTDDPQYRVSVQSMTIPPRSEQPLTVTFAPNVPGPSPATLTFASDDPDEPSVEVALLGEGIIPPEVRVAPSSLSSSLFTGGVDRQTVTISNVGGSDLEWQGRLQLASASGVEDTSGPLNTPPDQPDYKIPPAQAPGRPDDRFVHSVDSSRAVGTAPQVLQLQTLEDLFLALENNSAEITSRIPNRFDFFQGETGISIFDGGGDMYDGGNFLRTSLGGPLQYTNGPIVADPALGAQGRYFTRKYPGLFVMVADIDGLQYFDITGNLGADGFGSVDGSILESSASGVSYLGFVKRVYSAGDPSVNHLIIVERTATVSHEFSTNTNDDYHRVLNLGGIQRLHYLLYAGWSGAYIDDSAVLGIMNAYLSNLPAQWISADPLSGVVAPGSSQDVDVTFDATGLGDMDLDAIFNITSNDPATPLVEVPASLHVTAAPDIDVRGPLELVESRKEYTVTGAVTDHLLEVAGDTDDGARLEVEVDGNFASFFETATVFAEGIRLGQVGGTGFDCVPSSRSFVLDAALTSQLTADGVVSILVDNSASVDTFCQVNSHTVRFEYRLPEDRVEFGPLFIGLSKTTSIEVLNLGLRDLEVASVSSSHADYTVSIDRSVLAPGEAATLSIVFAPSSPGLLEGVLTITSDDPDEPELAIPLTGEGVIPPDIDVQPTSMQELMLIGRRLTRPLTVANTNVGGADLIYEMEVERGSRPAAAPMPPPPPGSNTAGNGGDGADLESTQRPPEGFEPATSQEVSNAGAEVLLIEFVRPFGTRSNENVLRANDIVFDMINPWQLPSTDLSAYLLVIVSSDQTTIAYQKLASHIDQLHRFVEDGGVLEFHLAGWGYHNGNASLIELPRGVRIVHDVDRINNVLLPGHPIVQNVPSRFQGNFASHGYLSGVPADAVEIVGDSANRANLVVYNHGLGKVITGGQTFEFGYSRGQATGQILANLIPWAYEIAQGGKWLTPEDGAGVVVAEDADVIDMVFDSADLDPGTYRASIRFESNDPDEPLVEVPAELEAVRLIADAGAPQELECDGNEHANTILDGSGSEHMNGPQDITAYDWYLGATLLGQGSPLHVPVPLGQNTVTLEIADATGATSTDDTQVTVVDTIPPTGQITYPPAGVCIGPDALPLVIEDDYTDICANSLVRDYGRPEGAVFTDHGDYDITLEVSDPSGNAGPSSHVSFTVDTVSPSVTILVDPNEWLFPQFIPFDTFFADHDNDGATGEVVHEWILVDACVLYDGLAFGDGDGLLLDERVFVIEEELCRLSRVCQRDVWHDPVIEVKATDCGGNTTTASFVKPGDFNAFDCH
jgi:subtilisin family serine protease